MTHADLDRDQQSEIANSPATTSRCVDWYAEGESRTVEVGGVLVTVRFVGRKGRRGRIAIEAPAGAAFRQGEGSDTIRQDNTDIPPTSEKRRG